MAVYTSSYRTSYYIGYSPPSVIKFKEGFPTTTKNKEHLKKHGLLDLNLLEFLNKLCFLVDENAETLPEKEWETLEHTLKRLIINYEDGSLCDYLVQQYGAEAISYNAWIHFNNDSDWFACLRTFEHMPTEVLERFAAEEWKERRKTIGEEGTRLVLRSIGERTDYYGKESLPEEMVRGLLFD